MIFYVNYYILDDSDPIQAKLKRPFKCDLCDKTFADNHRLRNHINKHTGALDRIPDTMLIRGNRVKSGRMEMVESLDH